MTPQDQLDGFIDQFSPRVAAQARAVLDRMRARLPGATQLVYDNYNALAIAFAAGPKLADVVFSIAVYPRWVSLFFAGGVALDDPLGLLKGAGSTVRHIVLETPETLDEPGVRTLIDQALAARVIPAAPPETPALVIKSVSARRRPRRPGLTSGA